MPTLKKNKLALTFFAFLIFFRVFVFFYGYDRLPLFPSNDEASINDASVALSYGKMLSAPSFGENVGFKDYYAQYPPLFQILQSFFLKTMGVTPPAIRFLNIFCFLGIALLINSLLFSLYSRGVLSKFALIWGVVLATTFPDVWYLMRQGRPDGLGIFLGMAGLLVSTWAYFLRSLKMWWAAAFLMGLALSTHLQMLSHFGVFVLIAMCVHYKNIRLLISLICLPFLVFVVVWVAMHGVNSGDALKQMLHIMSLGQQKADSLLAVLNYLKTTEIQAFTNRGGFFLLLTGVCWLSTAGIFLYKKIQSIPLSGMSKVALLAVSANILGMFFFLGTTVSRFVTIWPLSLIAFCILLSTLSLTKIRKILISVFLCSFVLMSLLDGSLYAFKTHQERESRNPERYLKFVSSLPRELRIAVEHPFWYPAVKINRQCRLIAPAEKVDVNFWKNHSKELNDFDIIIIAQNNDVLLELIETSDKKKEELFFGKESFFIFSKKDYLNKYHFQDSIHLAGPEISNKKISRES